MNNEIYDVIIVGGGPAGLNAAIVLGRCRRKVLLFDTGRQRNRMSHGIHNFITRDNILPADFLKIALNELIKYGVVKRDDQITFAVLNEDQIFEVEGEHKEVYLGKKLLIATGLRDILPSIPGIEPMYGKSVFHCPYCDGWEVKDKRIAVYAKNKNGFDLALSLKTWSNDIQLYCDGANYLTRHEKELLHSGGIVVIKQKIKSVEGNSGMLSRIVTADGSRNGCDALFFVNGYESQCDLINKLGCTLNKKGSAITNRKQQTNIRGLYVAGDVAKDVHFVVVAAGEGAKAAVCINQELQQEEIESLHIVAATADYKAGR